MTFRIAKNIPLSGLGYDIHSAMGIPPLPPLPVAPWMIMAVNPLSEQFLTGKFTRLVTNEGMGSMLWRSDRKPLQPHVCVTGPYVATPTTALLPIASQAKFWLPAFSIKEVQEGALSGGKTPIAVCFPAYMMAVQSCQDINGWGFVLPNTILFTLMSTRVVNVVMADFAAGMIGMLTDVVSNLIASGFGKGIGLPDSFAGGVAGALMNDAITGMGLYSGTLNSDNGEQQGFTIAMVGLTSGLGVANAVSFLGGNWANSVGQAGQPPEPAPAPAPSGG